MIGKTFSHYTILDKLGEGGMGVVYKAEDTRLKRMVALKFLPSRVSESAVDRARFLQEAQAAAALNHPNICTIYGIEEDEGQSFIAMEFIDGQTLHQKRGTISLPKAIEIGIQIAEGLAAAHERGIVHRDIKPDNIMVRKDGIAQIMDFGLAKLRASQASRLTKEGSTVGTAGYMSPEQVQGQEADHRSDIFSLGVVLYELFTGELPFKGVHDTALMYEIVNVDPAPMNTLKPEIDPELDRIVLECLQKEPDERYNAVKDIAKDLRRFKRESSRQRMSRVTASRPALAAAQPAGAPRRPHTPWAALAGYLLSGLLALALIVLVVHPWREPQGEARPVVRFSIELPDNAPLGAAASGIAVSPDGKYIAYRARVNNGFQLYLHPVDRLTSQPVTGTEGVADMAFSPDGQWIVFSAAGRILKTSLSGGAPEVICQTPGFTRGLFWAADNSILFGVINDAIYRVPAAGGALVPVTSLDTSAGEISHRGPQLLPDGKTVIYTVKQNTITTFNDAVIVAQRLDGGERKVVVRGGTYPKYIPTGHLMYLRGDNIFAVPFDADRLETAGPAVAVETGGWMLTGSGAANVDFSRNGLLVYAPNGQFGDNVTSLAWLDRAGISHPLFDTLRAYAWVALSPDGQKIALSINAANNDIWVYHITRGLLMRLTFGGGNNDFPVWSPDGKYIIYTAEKGRTANLFRRPWEGSGSEERLTSSPNPQEPSSCSADGKFLAYGEKGDIWILPLNPQGSGGGTPYPFIQTPATERNGLFSPDGRWLAYSSNESGKDEVYVTSFPGHEGKWQISNGGGAVLFWARDGKELFYAKDSLLMAVRVLASKTFDFSVPRNVCTVSPLVNVQDIAADGRSFLATVSQKQPLTAPRLEAVDGWFEVVKSKFAGAKN